MGINFFGVYPGDPVREKGWIPIAIAAGSAIAGGMMQNSANKDMAASANALSAKEAQNNREWQERMSNTAHQREVADLKAAGLNPILSATGGSGASSPSGNVAQVQTAHMEDAIGKGVSSAKDAYNLSLQTKSLEGDLALKDSTVTAQAASTAASVASAKKIDAETDAQKMQNRFLRLEEPVRAERYRREGEEEIYKRHNLRPKYDAERSSAKLEDTTSTIDRNAAYYDAIMNRAQQATQTVQNLVPAVRLKTQFGDQKIRTEHRQMKNYLQRKGQIER